MFEGDTDANGCPQPLPTRRPRRMRPAGYGRQGFGRPGADSAASGPAAAELTVSRSGATAAVGRCLGADRSTPLRGRRIRRITLRRLGINTLGIAHRFVGLVGRRIGPMRRQMAPRIPPRHRGESKSAAW